MTFAPPREHIRKLRSPIALLAVMASGLALVVSGCGGDGASRAPTTTIPSEPAQVTQPEDSGEADEEDGDEDEKGKKDKGKDRGKSQGNGEGDDSD